MGDYSRTDGRRNADKEKRHNRPRGQGQPERRRTNPASRRRPDSRHERNTGRAFRGGCSAPVKTAADLPDVAKLPRFAEIVCARCGEPIKDITGAMADKTTGEPVHFDCVLKFLEETEPHEKNEKILYIGHGCFAVVVFEHPSDLRKFRIVRHIEWEDRDAKPEWRAGVQEFYDLPKDGF